MMLYEWDYRTGGWCRSGTLELRIGSADAVAICFADGLTRPRTHSFYSGLIIAVIW